MVESGPGLRYRRCVGQHADGSLHLRQIPPRHHGRWLIVDANLESRGTPVYELDGPLRLDGSNGGVDILRNDVPAVEHAAGHVLAVPGVALDHLVSRLEAGVSYLSNAKLLMVCLLRAYYRRVGHEGEVDSGVGDKVGLELRQVHIQGPVEPERGGYGGDYLSDESVQVGVGRTLYVQVPPTDVVDSLVVDHEGAVGVLEGGVGGEDGVVRLNHRAGDLRRRVDGELELGFLPVVDGESLHEERGESGPCAPSKGVEYEEPLETGALVRQLPDAVQHQVYDLLSDGVVPARVVVSRVFFPSDQLFGVEQLSVGSGSHLVHHCRFQIHKDGARHVLACSCLREEGVG